jgi:hypothetical protein
MNPSIPQTSKRPKELHLAAIDLALAAADQPLEPEKAAHLVFCPFCQREVAMLQRLQAMDQAAEDDIPVFAFPGNNRQTLAFAAATGKPGVTELLHTRNFDSKDLFDIQVIPAGETPSDAIRVLFRYEPDSKPAQLPAIYASHSRVDRSLPAVLTPHPAGFGWNGELILKISPADAFLEAGSGLLRLHVAPTDT